MTRYFPQGDIVRLTSDLGVHKTLPVATYSVRQNQDTGEFFLKMMDNFSFGRVYGNANARADRIIRTFESREQSTGVLLVGEKGSGKTLLAKIVSAKMAKKGMATLIINEPFSGEGFNAFLQSIHDACCVIFDEFEKVYGSQDATSRHNKQGEILTLLDGTYPTKKLFVLTCNDKWKIDTHMMNRPGRIFYCIEYGPIEEEFVREYATENLNDKSMVERVIRLSQSLEKFNFDMLKALVEEMNRYEEDPREALRFLNIRPEVPVSRTYSVEFTLDSVPQTIPHSTAWIDPTENIPIQYGDGDKRSMKTVYFQEMDIVKIFKGNVLYVKQVEGKEARLFLSPVNQRSKFDWMSL